jgi:hypothetical protein
VLFLAEEGSEPTVAAKLTATPSFRRLYAPATAPTFAPRFLASSPKVNGRSRSQRTLAPTLEQGIVLPSGDVMAALPTETVEVRLNDVLDDISRGPGESKALGLVAVEVKWSTTSAFEYARVGGASSMTDVVDGIEVTRWRLRRRDALVEVFLKPAFAGISNFLFVLRVREAGNEREYFKNVVVDVAEQQATTESALEGNAVPENHLASADVVYERVPAGSDEKAARRLETLDASSPDAVMLELLPLDFDLQHGTPFRLRVSDLLPATAGISPTTCETRLTVFTTTNAIDAVEAPSIGVRNVSAIHNPVVQHFCNEILLARLLPNVESVQIQLRVAMADADGSVLAIASLPISWTVIPHVDLPVMKQILSGAHDVPAGNNLELVLNYSVVLANVSVELFVKNCSTLAVQTTGFAQPTSEECTFLLKDASSDSVGTFTGVTLADQQEQSSTVAIELIVTQFQRGVDGTAWTVSSSSLTFYELHFCEFMSTNGGPLVLRKGKKLDILLNGLASTVLGGSLLGSQLLKSISFVVDTQTLSQVGLFQIDDALAQVEFYNSSASFVTLTAGRGESFSFTPMQYGSFLADVMLEWGDAFDANAGCLFVQNFVVSVVPSFSQPMFATPYSFSQKVLQGSAARITIPSFAATNPDIEYASLAVAVNTTDQIIMSRDGVEYYPSSEDQSHFVIIQRQDDLDSSSRVVISATPERTFTGVLRFSIGVAAIGLVDSAIPFEEISVEAQTIREVEVEWISIPEPLVEPIASGEAVYRSLPTQLQGNSKLSFRYHMSSGTELAFDIVFFSRVLTRLLCGSSPFKY